MVKILLFTEFSKVYLQKKCSLNFIFSYNRGSLNNYNNKSLTCEPNSKLDALKNMFHLCVENCSVENYYTEKILDCFANKVIPVYWGCTNIDKFFDKNGIINVSHLTNIEKIIDVINDLSENDYTDRHKSILNNYNLAMKCMSFNEHKKGRDIVNKINVLL